MAGRSAEIDSRAGQQDMKGKTCNRNVGIIPETAAYLVEEILWFSGRPASWIYWVYADHYEAKDDIEVVRPSARGLLERFRVHLLLQALYSRTVFDLQQQRVAMPNATGLRACLLRLRLVAGARPGGIGRELRHQFAWHLLRCLCFWRSRSWREKQIVRRNMFQREDGLYIQCQANPCGKKVSECVSPVNP